MLRKKGVVGKFVEFYGDGLECAEPGRSRHHRQHGAGVRRDHRLLPRRSRRRSNYLRFTNRAPEQVALVEAIPRSRDCSDSGRRRIRSTPDTLELDLARYVPSMAGPKRPQDRVELPDVKKNF